MKEIVKIVIPSYKRAGRVTTFKACANCALVVREEQYDDYKEAYPDKEIITIPKGEIENGIADTREWIMRNVNGGNVFMLDDDISSFRRAYTPGQYSEMSNDPDVDTANVVPPEVVYDIIQGDAHLCKELGIYLFGFTVSKNPRDCPPQMPYKLNAIMSGGAFGVLRGEPGCEISLPYHEKGVALCEDYYLILINAYYHRFNLVNNRFYEQSTTFRNTGGLSQYRTYEGEKEAYLYLRQKFGTAIKRKGQGVTNDGKMRKASSPYERVLDIPY